MYDIAIIGGGPAGYSAALTARKYGLQTILFEKDQLGGVCLNKGCIPTKSLIHMSEIYGITSEALRYGITFTDARLDFRKTRQEIIRIVEKQRQDLTFLMSQKKIEVVLERATILNPNTVIAAGKQYRAKNILIAVGSTPKRLEVLDHLISDDILELEEVPRTIKIIGGGIIAVEFAYFFNKLGCHVTVCLRSERILRKWDREIAVNLTMQMKRDGIEIIPNCSSEKMRASDAQIVFAAVGRIPNMKDIFVSDIGCQLDDGIVVDQYGRTNIPSIWAAGDVIAGSAQLAHIAVAQGKNAVEAMVGISPPPISVVPRVIYIQPEVATIGLTEADARMQGIRVIIGKQNMLSNARTAISSAQRGFIKIVVDVESHCVVGAQLLCERAGDMVGELILAINQRITVDDLANSILPHPSFCEEIIGAATEVINRLKLRE